MCPTPNTELRTPLPAESLRAVRLAASVGEPEAVKGCTNTHLTFRDSLALPRNTPVFVQVRISQVPTCARVREGWVASDGTFLWSLDLLGPFYGRGSFPESRVLACSTFDDRCTCVGVGPERDRASFSSDESGAGKTLTEGFTC